jgi:hypothetical protein
VWLSHFLRARTSAAAVSIITAHKSAPDEIQSVVDIFDCSVILASSDCKLAFDSSSAFDDSSSLSDDISRLFDSFVVSPDNRRIVVSASVSFSVEFAKAVFAVSKDTCIAVKSATDNEIDGSDDGAPHKGKDSKQPSMPSHFIRPRRVSS